METIRVAPLADALTFARVSRDGSLHTLAVTRYEHGEVEAVDLTSLLERPDADAIELFREHGYDRIRDVVAAADGWARIIVPAHRLLAPIDLGDRHVAAGTNFPEHAGEADVDDGPFLFAKLVAPTAPYAEVSTRGGLLDYEVEIGFVALEAIAEGESPDWMGLVLCNDYTDRETLLEHIDVWDVASGKGFTTGKSFPGFLPIGNLFLIPRDYTGFAGRLELRLYVNGELRQRATVREAVWDLGELLAQTWARRATTWEHRGEQVGLLDAHGRIPARSLILGGTPSGTIFRGIGLSHRIAGLSKWLFGGWSRPLAEHVVEDYVGTPQVREAYLAAGDRVTARAEYLGVIDNEIRR